MALPESRDKTFVDGADIPPEVLNNIQDSIVAGKHGDQVLILPATAMEPVSGWSYGGAFLNWETTTGNSRLVAEIPLRVGDRIKGVKVHCSDAGGGTGVVSAVLEEKSMAGGSLTVTTKSDSVSSDDSGTLQQVVLTNVVQEAIQADEVWRVSMFATAGSGLRRVHAIEITYDRP